LLRSQVEEVTTCPICFEDFSSPRSLPCLHSFCFKCLQSHCKDKQPGTKQQCPLCRVEFMIPQNGLEGLVVNFVLQNLIASKRASRAEPCEVCSTDEQFVYATVFCVQCSQRLCERCGLPHKRWSGGAHDVRPLRDELRPAAIEKDIQELNIIGKLVFVF